MDHYDRFHARFILALDNQQTKELWTSWGASEGQDKDVFLTEGM
jgi:hypothetical protein